MADTPESILSQHEESPTLSIKRSAGNDGRFLVDHQSEGKTETHLLSGMDELQGHLDEHLGEPRKPAQPRQPARFAQPRQPAKPAEPRGKE